MGVEVTVTLPDGVMRQARWLADRTGKPVADVIAETVEQSLCPLGSMEADERAALAAATDEEVQTTAGMTMPEAEDRRLSELLRIQGAGRLSAAERGELDARMQMFQRDQLRKALALQEAVRRGLRPPLGP
jgi:hypothetical protein